MFSVRCTEMGESGFAPTRRITNRFWSICEKCTTRIFLIMALLATPEKWETNTNRYSWADVAGNVSTGNY